ncbi:hypothetical protein G9A89_022327 [Geosiphon pyriformis]|nr:hypothetical protein G9A89_022327 [Geosiphon pyriformis]
MSQESPISPSSPLLSPLSEGGNLDEGSTQQRHESGVHHDQQLQEQELHEVVKESGAESDESNEEEAQPEERAEEISLLEEKDVEAEDKVEGELEEEYDTKAINQKDPENQRSDSLKTEIRSFVLPPDAVKLPKVSMTDLSQIHLRALKRSGSDGSSIKIGEVITPKHTSPLQSPNKSQSEEKLQISNENTSSISPNLQNKHSPVIITSVEKKASAIDDEAEERETTEILPKSPITSEPQELEPNDEERVTEVRKSTAEALKPTLEEELAVSEKNEVESKNKEILTASVREDETKKPVLKIPRKSSNPSTTSSNSSTSSTSLPSSIDIPRSNIAAMWHQREKDHQNEPAKPNRPPPLPPKKKATLDKWSGFKAGTTSTDANKTSKVAGSTVFVKAPSPISQLGDKCSSESITNSDINIKTGSKITNLLEEDIGSLKENIKIQSEVIEGFVQEVGFISETKEELESRNEKIISPSKDNFVKEKLIEVVSNQENDEAKSSEKIEQLDEINETKIEKESETKEEEKRGLPKILERLLPQETVEGNKEKGTMDSQSKPPTTEDQPAGKKKSRIALMIEEQERKRREEEEAAARPVHGGGRKVLDKLPWMTQKTSEENSKNTLSSRPPPRKISSSFLQNSTETTESGSTTVEPPKIKTGRIDSAISQRLESVFGSGKIPLPGMGRGIPIGGRKVMRSNDDGERDESDEVGEHRVQVMPGLKRSEAKTKDQEGVDKPADQDQKKENQENFGDETSGDKQINNENNKTDTDDVKFETKAVQPPAASKTLSHMTKDRPRRPPRSRPPIPKAVKVVPLPANPKKVEETDSETHLEVSTDEIQDPSTADPTSTIEYSEGTIIEVQEGISETKEAETKDNEVTVEKVLRTGDENEINEDK